MIEKKPIDCTYVINIKIITNTLYILLLYYLFKIQCVFTLANDSIHSRHILSAQ